MFAAVVPRSAAVVPRSADRDLAVTAVEARRRRPFSRTLTLARWSEYRDFLVAARRHDYDFWSIERWLMAGGPDERILILRHDVDQHPSSALNMARIEAELGVSSTWYFRWRTADPSVIAEIRRLGGEVGLHYETLTRLVRERDLSSDDVDDALVTEARTILRQEVEAFARDFGPLRSVAPHGDTRVAGVSNQVLVDVRMDTGAGTVLDGSSAVSRHRLGLWLTDRSAPDGRWSEGSDPERILDGAVAPVLMLTHPNNWCSGPSLWRDRLTSLVLPTPPSGRRRPLRLGVRTGGDRPPQHASPAGGRNGDHPAPLPDFGPMAISLRREVLRFYYDQGKRLTTPGELTTLATNSDLVESRTETLEHGLAMAGIPGLRDLDVADLGCGFGALSVKFAVAGARVTALDPNGARMRVGSAVARRHNLRVEWRPSSMQDEWSPPECFDVAVMNNSLCYLLDADERRSALEHTRDALRPGGVLVIRNPNRVHHLDQFSGLPLVGMLPSRFADAAARLLGRERSRVRLLTSRAARRELRRTGFVDVRLVRRPGELRLRAAVAGYQHLVARAPAREAGT